MVGIGVMYSSNVVHLSSMVYLNWRPIQCTLSVSLLRLIWLEMDLCLCTVCQGYAGYYGLSLISGSYAVLFVSLAAHAAQFAFLVFFENPRM